MGGQSSCMNDGKKPFVSKNSGFGRSTLHLPVLDLTGRDKSPKEALVEIGMVISADEEAHYFKRTYEAVQVMQGAMPTLSNKKPKIDDQDDHEPPDCFRKVEQESPQIVLQAVSRQQESLSKVVSFEFEDDFWRQGSLDGSLLSAFANELSCPPPPPPPLFYLMVYDHNTMNLRTFYDESKIELLKKFLIYFINEAHTEISRDAQAHLHAKVPCMPIRLQGNEYAIVCNAGGGLCKHTEVGESRESLIVQLFAHFVVEHCKNSEWHKNISKNISGSMEEAQAKLYGSH